MGDVTDQSDKRREDAAKAAWLYFIGGRTQDDIARQLDLSRQAVQRLVSFAVSEKLIKFRMDHPIASCMAIAKDITDRYQLEFCDVVPTDSVAPDSIAGIATATAQRMNRLLAAKAPTVLAVGTGRTLRAAVDEMDALDRPQHKIVSLVGNMAADGHASPYEVAMRLADKIGAQRYPMPAPVLTETAEERQALQSQRSFAILRELRAQARASFVGIGDLSWQSPLHKDGFVNDAEIAELIDGGAIGEIIGWPFDASGRRVDSPIYDRVASLSLETPPERLTVVVGSGPQKTAPLKAALAGRLLSALVTDEATAAELLDE
ncbi:MAG: sugar-binding transcriptional regulator [Alphaproteobacteria bacterium]|nr:sugar-binding transcriptional regulator [Alphaproteobacteria bacterium]